MLVQKRVAIVLVVLILVSVVFPANVYASNGTGSITIFVPNSSRWLVNTAEAFTKETGISVNIESAGMRYEDYCAELPALLQGADYDVVLSMVQPAETSYNYKNLVNLRDVIANDPSFALDDYFTNVIDSYSQIDGNSLYTMPISFDISLLAASEQAADSLGYELPETIPSRKAFTELCGSIPASDNISILADIDETLDIRSGGVSRTGWIAHDFMIEALSLITVDKFPRYEDRFRWRAIFSDYFEYYSKSAELSEVSRLNGKVPSIDLMKQGKLLFGRVELRELFTLGFAGDYRYYKYPYSDAGLEGTYHSVKGFSILKNGNEQEAWEFIKYVLSYDVQNQLEGCCPILRRAARERMEGIRIGSSSLLELLGNCNTPSYISPSGGEYLQSNTIFSYMQESSFMLKFAIAGIMERNNIDSTEMSYITQSKILDHYKSISPHVRNSVSFLLYVIPLLLVIAACILVGIVSIENGTLKRIKGYASGTPTDQIHGRTKRLKRLAYICFSAAVLFVAVSFVFDEKAALLYPLIFVTLAILMVALGIFLLFCAQNFRIEIFDGKYLILKGIKGYYISQKDIESLDWSIIYSGCKLIINGPRVIFLRYYQYKDLDRLRAYI